MQAVAESPWKLAAASVTEALSECLMSKNVFQVTGWGSAEICVHIALYFKGSFHNTFLCPTHCDQSP